MSVLQSTQMKLATIHLERIIFNDEYGYYDIESNSTYFGPLKSRVHPLAHDMMILMASTFDDKFI